MKDFLRKLKFHINRFFFEKLAIPNVRNEKISKIILKKYLRKDPVIIDCGSHDGSDSIELSKLFKQATIHSFEAVDTIYKKLQENTKQYANIKCYPLALADRTGVMDFYISEGLSDGSSSLLEPAEHLKDHPETFFSKKVPVKTITLDGWAKENSITRVDMLWLDMQGFELNMLKESTDILNTVSVIHTEISTKETYRGVAQYQAYRSFLESKGFTMKMEAIPDGWDMGNVLFVKEKNK